MKVWKKTGTTAESTELIFENELEQFVLERLGVEIKPYGGNGVYSQEQQEFISVMIDWYLEANEFYLEDKEYNDEQDYFSRNYDVYYREVI